MNQHLGDLGVQIPMCVSEIDISKLTLLWKPGHTDVAYIFLFQFSIEFIRVKSYVNDESTGGLYKFQFLKD